jgi:hypothetical protein
MYARRSASTLATCSKPPSKRARSFFIPKAAVDREIAEGLEDLRQGRAYGPYRSASEMIRALHRITGKAKKKPKRK